METLAIVAASTFISLALVLGRSWTLLLCFTLISGLMQAPLMAIFESSSVQLLDDVPALILIGVAAVFALQSPNRHDRGALLVFVALMGLIAFALVRSPEMGVGFAQARQIIMPIGLVLTGFVMRDKFDWPRVWRFVLALAMISAVWVIIEEILQAPLINPVWYYVEGVGARAETLRNGLPPAYYADGVGGEVAFRAGGPFLNPPITGFLLGIGAYAAAVSTRGITRVVALLILAGALVACYARAGLVIYAVVIFVYLAWVYVGKFAGVIVTGAFASYAAVVFLEQGNTASHTDGLLTGFQTALTSPLGLGFGTTGYQAVLDGAAAGVGSESLLGLWLAWLGWPMLAAIALVAVALVRRLRVAPKAASRPIWLAVAAITVAAVSESASSLAATVPMWVTVGFVLATFSPRRENGPSRNRLPASAGTLSARP